MTIQKLENRYKNRRKKIEKRTLSKIPLSAKAPVICHSVISTQINFH